MNEKTLHNENQHFHGTSGVSKNCRNQGFQPAFQDSETGRVEVSRQQNGEPAAMHLISWLPQEWATTTEECGAVLTLKPAIVSGFLRDGVFYTPEEAAELGAPEGSSAPDTGKHHDEK